MCLLPIQSPALTTLFRRERIDERSLDAQFDQIQQEEEGLQQQIEHLQGLLQNAHSPEATLRSTEEPLQHFQHALAPTFILSHRRDQQESACTILWPILVLSGALGSAAIKIR